MSYEYLFDSTSDPNSGSKLVCEVWSCSTHVWACIWFYMHSQMHTCNSQNPLTLDCTAMHVREIDHMTYRVWGTTIPVNKWKKAELQLINYSFILWSNQWWFKYHDKKLSLFVSTNGKVGSRSVECYCRKLSLNFKCVVFLNIELELMNKLKNVWANYEP